MEMANEQGARTANFTLSSMTGHGRARVGNEDVAVVFVAKSVNHRGLDIKWRLPEALEFLEQELSSELLKLVGRGRIDIEATIEDLRSPDHAWLIDEMRLEALLKKFKDWQARFPDALKPVSIGDLLALPGMFIEAKTAISPEQLSIFAQKSFGEALKGLADSRHREGLALGGSLTKMVTKCEGLVKEIEDIANSSVDKRFLRLKSRINELFADFDIKDDRLYQECALLVERSDFQEEIDRLHVHLKHFTEVCQNRDPKGRRLDFICQEMLRESNTLLSKVADQQATIKAIILKTEIERLREQVQNIE